MNIIILGKGYVGTALFDCLNKTFDDDTDCVNIYSKAELDYTDRSTLVNRITPETWVINTCGYTGRPNVDACEDNKDDTWYYNVCVPMKIMSSCKETGAHFVHVSSGCIYDGYDKDYTENDEPNFGLLSNESSWYSKTKHAGEMSLKNEPAHILRIRMPFCATWSERNVLTKLIKYDNVIDCVNSMTNLEDFCLFISHYITQKEPKPGLYNVVNPGKLPTSEILYMLRKYSLENPNWNTITLDELYKTTKAKRSNCVLSDQKIENMNLQLPDVLSSLNRCCKQLRTTKQEQ